MIADEGSDPAGDESQRGNVEPCLAFDLVGGRRWPGDLADALDHDDALQGGPLMALLKPGDVVDDGYVSGLDAPVIAVDRPLVADGSILESLGFLFGSEELDIVAQRALVAFEGEDVVGFLVHDLLGD